MIEIKAVTGRVLYTAESAADVRAALVGAVKGGAYLRGADLRGATRTCATRKTPKPPSPRPSYAPKAMSSDGRNAAATSS